MIQRRRSDDRGWLTRGWDWIDARDIDKHLLSLAIFYGTIKITTWAMHYADKHSTSSGIEVAAVVAAVMAPYMALQGAAIKFYFEART